MLRRRKSPALIAIPIMSAIVALTLTGCSGGSKTVEAEEGPLGKYMSALWGGEEWSQEQYEKEQKQTEELVAVCMQDEGFEYLPNVQSGGMVMFDDEDGPQWGTEEFAKEFGYGMSTDPWGTMEASPDDGEDEYFDPNEEYVSTLSESEMNAFYETLYGAGPTDEQMAEAEETGSYTSDWTQEGCYGAARHEVEQENPGGATAYEDPEFTDLFAAMDEMYMQMWNEDGKHEELTKLDIAWAECMADNGYSQFTSPDSASMQVSEELNEIYMMGQDPEGEWVEPTQADQDKMEADIKAFQSYEIEIATADFACKDKTGYTEKSTQLQFDLEQQFVDENKAELDALLAKYATKSEGK